MEKDPPSPPPVPTGTLQHDAPEKKSGVLSQRVADFGSAVASVAVGAVTAWRLIDERAYKNLTSLYLTEDIKDMRRLEGPRIWKRLNNKEHTEQTAYRDVQETIHSYEGKMDERFGKLGIKNTWDRLGLLRNHQKWEVAITSLAVTGIALGSLILLTRDLFAAKPKPKDEAPQPIEPRPASFVEAEQDKAAHPPSTSLAL